MTLQEKKFYRVKEVCAALSISRVTLWKWIKKGAAPQLERLNARVAGYSHATLEKVRSGLQS
jgi:predicted DNA-binding transcriptional regulator AlpA